MKIYDRQAFAAGVICLGTLLLFAAKVLQAGWPQWGIVTIFAVRFFYTALSKGEAERQRRIRKNYRRVARERYGKYAAVKTNLLWIVTGVFFAVGLLVRFVFDVAVPVWTAVVFVLCLTLAVFYEIRLNGEITEEIDRDAEENQNP